MEATKTVTPSKHERCRVGIFDALKRNRRIDPTPLRATEDYKRRLKGSEAEVFSSWQAAFEGLNEREACVVAAAAAGLVDIPNDLGPRLELYRNRILEMEREEAEAGVVLDDSTTATRLLVRQSWWPAFIASIRQELGIRTAADIGRWSTHGKKIAPYVWECGFVFQTPEAAQKNGPVSVWSWRVDLEKGTTEPLPASDRDQVPWDEVGSENARRLVSTSDELSRKMKEGLGGLSGPAILDFQDRRWRYEFCIFMMFWMWYVANSPKLTKAGARKPLLDAYHQGCCDAMVGAGLIESSEESIRAWEGDLEERFMAYKGAYENVHTRPDFPLRVTGRGSVGWLLARYLFPGRQPDPRLVLLLNDFGSLTFRGLVEMITSLEAQYYQRADGPKPRWKFWK
ncbi:MAG: hypothetical protein ABSA52_06810 [Candidatus Binatia bacterium]